MRTCVFAGSFDPFTKGHAFVVEKCLEIFDKVIIAIGVNVDKKPLFSLEKRKTILCELYQDNDRIKIAEYQGMLTDFMKKNDVKFTVRGIRNQDDFKYESNMARYNEDMFPDCVTVYIQTPATLEHVSSTAMRNIISIGGDISQYLPEKCLPLLQKFIKEK